MSPAPWRDDVRDWPTGAPAAVVDVFGWIAAEPDGTTIAKGPETGLVGQQLADRALRDFTDDRATLGALEDLDAIEAHLWSARAHSGPDHPTARDELRAAWRGVASARRWLGDHEGAERIARAFVLGDL